MVFVTGDLHGNFERFKPKYFPEQARMTKQDIMICAGDFGGVWFGDSRDDETLDWLERLPFTLAFVCGNHENYDALERYPVAEWHGGKVHRVRPHVLHLMRGQIFELDGYRFFTMGGAKSHDIEDGILEPDAPDLSKGSRCSSASPERGTASTISRGGHKNCPPMRNTPGHGETLTRSAGRWTTSSPTALPPASPSWGAATTRRTGSQTSYRRYGKEQNTTTGCSAIITTTEPLMKSTSCCGSRLCGSSEAGQSREKHG